MVFALKFIFQLEQTARHGFTWSRKNASLYSSSTWSFNSLARPESRAEFSEIIMKLFKSQMHFRFVVLGSLASGWNYFSRFFFWRPWKEAGKSIPTCKWLARREGKKPSLISKHRTATAQRPDCAWAEKSANWKSRKGASSACKARPPRVIVN